MKSGFETLTPAAKAAASRIADSLEMDVEEVVSVVSAHIKSEQARVYASLSASAIQKNSGNVLPFIKRPF